MAQQSRESVVLNIVITPVPSQTGRAIVLSTVAVDVVNDSTGEVSEGQTGNFSDNLDQASFNVIVDKPTPLLTYSFSAGAGYFFSTPPVITTEAGEVNGEFDQVLNITTNESGQAIGGEIILYFTAFEGSRSFSAPAVVGFSGNVATVPTTALLLHSTSFPIECGNLRQNLELVVRGEIGAQFKVTATASGISNIVPDNVVTIREYEETAVESDKVSVSVVIPIPARTTDTTWTVTIVPETGTSNGPAVLAMTLTQHGLKALTFTDDTTNMSNTTFSDKVLIFKNNMALSKRFVEQAYDDLDNRYNDYTNVVIPITASSGVVTLKARSTKPKLSSSFTNIASNKVRIALIKTVQTSSTVVTLSFKVLIPSGTPSFSSAIKLSDFLTN